MLSKVCIASCMIEFVDNYMGVKQTYDICDLMLLLKLVDCHYCGRSIKFLVCHVSTDTLPDQFNMLMITSSLATLM